MFSADEISQARQYLLLDSQRVAFADDYKRLLNSQTIGAKSRLLPFSPFLDKDTQLIRARGRLSKLPLDYCSKHPIILDAKQRPVELFLQHLHSENGHCGLEHLRSVLHSEYWVLNSRNAIRKVVKTCYDCRRQKAAGLQPEMSDLPTFRFPDDKPFPFQQVGLDLFGPFATKMELTTHDDVFEKRWGLLLTCLTTRAVHIEVCESLSVDNFIHAFRRFIARRGQPKFVISDNGTNFTAAEKDLRTSLQSLRRDKVFADFAAQQDFSWTFSPPGAPHFGGVWERLIRSLKDSFYAVIGSRCLTNTTLSTLLCGTESFLNSRPLTAVSSDVADAEPLTPNHFLLGRPTPKTHS